MYQPEVDTDPGGPHPYESLYRNSATSQPQRPTPRHYEPSLSPPEGQAESADRYRWLYRDESEAPTAPSSSPRTASAPPPPEPPRHAARPGSPGPAPARPHRRSLVVALIVLLLLVAAGSGVGIALALSDDAAPGGQSPPTAGDAPTADPSGASPPAGGEALVRVVPTLATPDCQAPPATDSAGNKVSYGPARMLDGDNNTAWRCDGSGIGKTITFAFPAGTKIARVGLVNGYAKVDSSTDAHLYGQYRRISQATWTFPDETKFRQTLTDGTETVQMLRIPVREASEVSLTIDVSTTPGHPAKTRDAVLISEVEFTGPPG